MPAPSGFLIQPEKKRFYAILVVIVYNTTQFTIDSRSCSILGFDMTCMAVNQMFEIRNNDNRVISNSKEYDMTCIRMKRVLEGLIALGYSLREH